MLHRFSWSSFSVLMFWQTGSVTRHPLISNNCFKQVFEFMQPNGCRSPTMNRLVCAHTYLWAGILAGLPGGGGRTHSDHFSHHYSLPHRQTMRHRNNEIHSRTIEF